MSYTHALPAFAQVESDDDTQTLSWLFTQGLDPTCSGPCTAMNCCGVHIHEGTSCDDASTIGGHFWNMDLIPEDPWQDIRYTIQGGLPSALNDLSVTTGLGPEDITGRTVVVHDYNGVRIGCAVIQDVVELPAAPVDGEDLYAFDFSPYPGSSSPYQPTGVVEVKSVAGDEGDDDEPTTVLSWSLSGVDPNCNSQCAAANCCGVIIREGRGCSAGSSCAGGRGFCDVLVASQSFWVY